MIPCVTELGESWAKLEIACVCGKVCGMWYVVCGCVCGKVKACSLDAMNWLRQFEGDECDIYRCFEGCFRLGKQVDLVDICYKSSVKGGEMVWLPEVTF